MLIKFFGHRLDRHIYYGIYRPDRRCQPFCHRRYAGFVVPCLLRGATLLWARIAAKFANEASAITLNRETGVVLAVLGAAILVVNYVK